MDLINQRFDSIGHAFVLLKLLEHIVQASLKTQIIDAELKGSQYPNDKYIKHTYHYGI